MSYIKPLRGNASFKPMKWEIRVETMHCDFDDFVSTVMTMRTPYIPSGGVFSFKTWTCTTWASSAYSQVAVTFEGARD